MIKKTPVYVLILAVLLGLFFTGRSEGLTVHLVAEHYVESAATAYFTQHNNKSKTHGSAAFEGLRHCPDLLALDLSHNEITDLSFLRHCPKLKILLLGDNDIIDISPLADLHDLEYLELWKNHITDFSPLAGLNKVIDLNVCFNRCDDLRPLHSLTRLERLWIYNSNNYSAKDPVDKDEVAKLHAALPGTNIDSISYSTLGGWRDHPRHFVVRDIFRKYKRYVPWGGMNESP